MAEQRPPRRSGEEVSAPTPPRASQAEQSVRRGPPETSRTSPEEQSRVAETPPGEEPREEPRASVTDYPDVMHTSAQAVIRAGKQVLTDRPQASDDPVPGTRDRAQGGSQ